MRHYYGYVVVADEEEARKSTETLERFGAHIVKGLKKYILGKIFIYLNCPWLAGAYREVVVFHCPTEELAYSCITREVMENGGFRVQ